MVQYICTVLREEDESDTRQNHYIIDCLTVLRSESKEGLTSVILFSKRVQRHLDKYHLFNI